MRHISSLDYSLGQNRHWHTELKRTLQVEDNARRYKFFQLNIGCRVGYQNELSKTFRWRNT
jgi:hypothetical protein